jgi:hypothetical protein
MPSLRETQHSARVVASRVSKGVAWQSVRPVLGGREVQDRQAASWLDAVPQGASLTRWDLQSHDMNEPAIEGRVIRPGEDGYDEQRLPWQRRFDSRPALIVEAAVQYAREADLPLAVRGTGRRTVVADDDALLLKTGALKSVDVDPHSATTPTAADVVPADAGCAHGRGPVHLSPVSGSLDTAAEVSGAQVSRPLTSCAATWTCPTGGSTPTIDLAELAMFRRTAS